MYDVVVVGAGVEGLCAARHLAKNKKKTLLLDQFEVPNNRGSSKGQTRGLRHTYDKFCYAQMIPESLRKWKELEKEVNNKEENYLKLFINTGLLTVCADPKQSNKFIENHHRLGLNFEVFTGIEAKKKFPGIKPNSNSVCLYEKEAGVLIANLCLLALKKSFLSYNGKLEENKKVISISPQNENHVIVNTKTSCYEAKSIIITCGAWTNSLLKSIDIEIPMKILLLEVIYWKGKTKRVYSAAAGYPLSCWEGSSTLVYSVPSIDEAGLVKVALHDGIEVKSQDIGSPVTFLQSQKVNQNLLRITRVVKERYPDLIPVVSSKETCFYQMTDDDDFIIDRHPRYKNVVFGAGFSGHGFKMAPIIGEMLSDLALNKHNKYWTKNFSLTRINKNKSLL